MIKPIFITLFFIFSFNLFAKVKTEFTINNQRSLSMAKGQQALWQFKYYKESGEQINQFMTMHAKKMHMVIIKKDLSHIAHIHPYLQKDGSFVLKSNSKYPNDFDNQGTPLMTPSGGDYFVFAETMPMGTRRPKGVMLIDRYNLKVSGINNNVSNNEVFKKGHKFEKYFDKNGKVSKKPSFFKVVLDYEMYDFCKYYLPKFYLSVLHRVGTNYLPVKKFNRWLSMGGHAILIKSDDLPLEKKVFKHLHAFLPIATAGEFTFPYHDHKNPLASGNYKIWTQHRINNKIYTFDFSFYLDVPVIEPNNNKCK